MTDIVLDITKYLNSITDDWFGELRQSSDNEGTGNLFMNDMPPSPDFAVAVIPYQGGPPDETFRNPLHVRNPRVQIMVRHPYAEVAYNRAGDILRRLVVVKDQLINGTKYQRITSQGEPTELGPDSSNRQRAVVNFQTSFYDSI